MRNPIIFGCMAATVVLLAGCGGTSYSGGSSSSTKSQTTATNAASKLPAAAASSHAYGQPVTASSSGGTAVAVLTKPAKMGTILAAGPTKLTVYLFEADKGTTSTCTGACAGAWPPVTSTAAATASGQVVAADLGTTKRADGTTQVTYKGHPLYFFIKDKDSGDAYGQGEKAFGASWYVLAPNGNKIDSDSNTGGGSDS